MKSYITMTKEELQNEFEQVQRDYLSWKKRGLSLDMSRGKPGPDQMDVSNKLFDMIKNDGNFRNVSGIDCRNYGGLSGLIELRALFAEIMGVDPHQVMVGGNSSLNMMFDVISQGMTHGFAGCKPWLIQGGTKFICFTPGYDRHFAIAEYFGMELVSIPLTEEGPDMDMLREAVKDEKVKGMFCVPKYSNPSGIIYSDRVVKEIAALTPAAKDFRIIWDDAYAIHGFGDNDEKLLGIYEECVNCGHEDMVIIFSSTSKISFPGAGVAALAASPANLDELQHRMGYQTIGPDKLNQLRHARAFKNMDELKEHMRRHGEILKPKFDTVLRVLDKRVEGLEIASYTRPTGGYFIYLTMLEGTAKRTVELCKEAGLVLTPAGATHPHGINPLDNSIRIAPSYPLIPELKSAAELLAVAVKYAALEKMLSK